MEIHLLKIRRGKRLSIQKVSELTGISVGAISNYENGRRPPNLEQLVLFARIYNCKIVDLFDCPEKW